MSKSLKEQAAIDRQERVMNSIKEQNARKLHNELRLGNWMKLKAPMDPAPEYAHVTQVYMSGFSCDYHWTGNWYEPIPLTPEVLEKCGFTEASDTEYGGWISPFVNGEAIRIRLSGKSEFYYTANKYSNPAYIKSIHQLQNLYYTLTGEELTYKP